MKSITYSYGIWGKIDKQSHHYTERICLPNSSDMVLLADWAMSVNSLLIVDINDEGVEPRSGGNSLSPGKD